MALRIANPSLHQKNIQATFFMNRHDLDYLVECRPMAMKSLTPVLMVNNVPDSVAFYEREFGFKCLVVVPDIGTPVFAILKCGSVDIMIQQRESLEEEIPFFAKKELGGTFTIYINVEDVQVLYEKVKPNLTLVQELHDTFYGSTEFAVLDCNGYVLAFAEHKSA